MDSTIRDRYQIVQLSRNASLVSHETRKSLNKVCIINSLGEIIKCYDRELRQDNDQFHFPYSVAVDTRRQYIFVADGFNGMLMVLDYNLRFLLEAFKSIRFERSNRLLFDSSTNRLIVGERAGRLMVIGFSRLVNF